MTQLRVLILEGDALAAEVCRASLERVGMAVAAIAGSGEQALACARDTAPGLALVDVGIRGRIDGIAAALALREQFDIPVVYLTSHPGELLLDRVKRSRPAGYVRRPVSDLDLRIGIEAALERYSLEQQLADGEGRFAATCASIADAVITTDTDGRVTFMNPVAEALTHWTRQEALGLPVAQVYTTVDSAAGVPFESPIARALREGTASAVADRAMLVTRHGDHLPVDDNAAPIRDARKQVRGAVLVFRDVSERHHAQEEARKAAAQMRQALRMEAIGRLAGGVAHDINNLMTVVVGCGDLLLGELPAEHPHRQLVTDLKDAGDRAVAMATQLLAFGRKQMLVPAVASLNDIIERTQQMLRRVIREDIRVVCDLSPTLGRVKIDPGQMEQVLVNLALNARDAMPEGGTLTLSTCDVTFSERSPDRAPEVRPGPYVTLTVADTGTGMDPLTRAHIFEPFFTTKPSGKGTGLGLATVYGIVKQSDGYIYVRSEVGTGTTFTIYLPQVADEATPPPPVESTVQPRGTETVLLVEDDDGVRAIARLILQKSGYTVLEATDGAEALRLYERHERHIDLLLTDAVMPNMGGRALAERFTAARPGVRVLFMSSYTPDDSLRLGVRNQQAAFLQKPFTAGTLTRKVRQVLDDGHA